MMNKRELLGKWTILVGINSILCFYLAMLEDFDNLQALIGIIGGIVTLIVAYASVDFYLYKNKKDLFRKWLFCGALTQFCIQLFLPLYIMIGIITIGSVEFVFKWVGYSLHSDFLLLFLNAYFVTVSTGLLLSFSVFCLSALFGFIEMKVMPYYRNIFI